jgi:hypothetical protein
MRGLRPDFVDQRHHWSRGRSRDRHRLNRGTNNDDRQFSARTINCMTSLMADTRSWLKPAQQH